jgi:hypothetical protein
MIKFNWNIIKKYTKDDINKILDYFANVYVLQGTMYNFLTKNVWASNIFRNESPKDSYILNLNDLIRNDLQATKEEQYVYLDLVSRRDIFTYFNTKGKVNFLPYWKVEDTYTDIDRLKLNRLLIINENNIYFIYEGDF